MTAVATVVEMARSTIGTVGAQASGGDWWGPMHPMMGGGWGVLMMLMMLVFWGLVIAAIVVGIRWLGRQSGGQPPTDRALEILRERYARGDITREEFEARKGDLLSR